MRGIGTHFVAYIPAWTGCPCEFGEVGPFFADVYTPTFASNIVDKVENISGVEDAAPYLMFRVENLTIAGIDVDSLATRTTAVSPETLVTGSFLTNSYSDGVLVNEAVAEVLNLDVGDVILLTQDANVALPVMIEDVEKFKGLYGTYKGNKAIQIVGETARSSDDAE